MALANLGWQINTFFNSKLASMLLDKYINILLAHQDIFEVKQLTEMKY
jgi:hypothetical protein